jgi:type IV secretion system protein VirB9
MYNTTSNFKSRQWVQEIQEITIEHLLNINNKNYFTQNQSTDKLYWKWGKLLLVILFVFLSFLYIADINAVENRPIAIDSRIKTYIYSENEVFRLVVHYGYQTSIEFADGEEIQTISVGNNYAWQLTPIGRRLFIKPLEENILTNMTILTNKRAYQFEVQSKLLSYTVDEELVYVVRFFYPEEDFDKNRPQITAKEDNPIPVVKPFNFNYSLSGPDAIAPIKVFDDGINTFFKFDDNLPSLPKFESKQEEQYIELQPKRRSDYIILNTIAPEFRLSQGNKIVTVYNESMNKTGSN